MIIQTSRTKTPDFLREFPFAVLDFKYQESEILYMNGVEHEPHYLIYSVFIIVVLVAIGIFFSTQVQDMIKTSFEKLKSPVTEQGKEVVEFGGLAIDPKDDFLTVINKFFSYFKEDYTKEKTDSIVKFNVFTFDTRGYTASGTDIGNTIINGLNSWYLGYADAPGFPRGSELDNPGDKCGGRAIGHALRTLYCPANYGCADPSKDICCPISKPNYISSVDKCCLEGYTYKNDGMCHGPSVATKLNIGDSDKTITWYIGSVENVPDLKYSEDCWNTDVEMKYLNAGNTGYILTQSGVTYNGNVKIRVAWRQNGNNIYPAITICDDNA